MVRLVDRNQVINGYITWEQAFRIFADVYTNRYPARSSELIQYDHIIHTASTNFVWENVYQYDVEFRMHMSRNPLRNWGIILQQAYTMCMKDRHNAASFYGQALGNQGRNGESSSSGKSKKLCYSFNKGKCTYGSKCKLEHRCGMCSRFGHGAHNCRKSGGVNFSGKEKEAEQNGDKNHNKHLKKNCYILQ